MKVFFIRIITILIVTMQLNIITITSAKASVIGESECFAEILIESNQEAILTGKLISLKSNSFLDNFNCSQYTDRKIEVKAIGSSSKRNFENITYLQLGLQSSGSAMGENGVAIPIIHWEIIKIKYDDKISTAENYPALNIKLIN